MQDSDITTRSIEIEHTDEGTTVAIEDLTWPEVVGLALIATVAIAWIWARVTKAREERAGREGGSGGGGSGGG